MASLTLETPDSTVDTNLNDQVITPASMPECMSEVPALYNSAAGP